MFLNSLLILHFSSPYRKSYHKQVLKPRVSFILAIIEIKPKFKQIQKNICIYLFWKYPLFNWVKNTKLSKYIVTRTRNQYKFSYILLNVFGKKSFCSIKYLLQYRKVFVMGRNYFFHVLLMELYCMHKKILVHLYFQKICNTFHNNDMRYAWNRKLFL